MGCGCGGGGRRSQARSSSVTPRPAGAVNARQVQPTQRQALVQQAKDRIQQASAGQVRNAIGARADIERRKRIQVSLKNRNSGKG